MLRCSLTDADGAAIVTMAAAAARDHRSIEDSDLVGSARALASRLPRQLIDGLDRFRRHEPAGFCVISGLPVDDAVLGPTPEHWRDSHVGSTTLAYEVAFLACAGVLGDVFGWTTQQDARIMHDVLPVKGHEHLEIGSNSLQHLSWHTEDAFHPCRADYVALLCLRNPDGVATTISDACDVEWDRIDVEALFEPEFTQLPDNSHLPDPESEVSDDETVRQLRARSFALIQSWNEQPEKRPILTGDRSAPYLALDPYHMRIEGWSERGLAAYRGLCDELERVKQRVVLRPGDCVFIDNFRAVHGREPFRPRYDGSDRWLKRLNITRDLRRSRAWRAGPDARIVH